MEQNQVDQLLAMYASKLPIESVNVVREKLIACDNYNQAMIVFSQMKDPTISLILSICLGCLGVDRLYIGDTALGVVKLITCGGCYIWWIIDLFLIMDSTRKKNLELLLMHLN